MKKLVVFLAAAVLSLSVGIFASAEQEVNVLVDNQAVSFSDQSPVIQEGRTLVPIRAVFEKAGAQVSWDQATQTATLVKGTYTVRIKLNEAYLYKNGKPVALDVPSSMINDRILIPVRAIAEAMDFGVTWDGVHYTVLVSTDGIPYRAHGLWSKPGPGFRDIAQAGIYLSGAFRDLEYDLNGDGEMDIITFKPQTSDEEKPVLSINGVDYGSGLPEVFNSVKAVAVVDVVSTDKYHEIIVIDGEDENAAWFYRYNGVDLLSLKSNATIEGYIPFYEKLFIDGVENIISDFDGLCFLDEMVCPGIYSLEDLNINRYAMNPASIIGRNLYRTYDDNMIYWIKYTQEFQPGKYLDGTIEPNYNVKQTDLPESYKILDFYVNDSDQSRFEFYIQYPDGTTAVIWPYKA